MLVPRRADHGHRDAVWSWIRNYWVSQIDWPIHEGHHDDGPFNISKAFNRAAALGPWDVAVITGADLVVPVAQVKAAVDKASETGNLVYAFDHFYYLSERSTERVLSGVPFSPSLAEWGQPLLGSAPAAVTREMWEKVGGFDEGFVGWGYEDVAFRYLCERGVGETRVPGPLFHLWHPVAPDGTVATASEANRQRYIDYLEGRL